jgi:RNA polymerase-binding transcription factor DksA
VDDALAKIEGDTYGTCESCGQQIAEGRLEAMPSARFCMTCASAPR